MAPNGHAPGGSRAADRSSQSSSRPVWLKRHGDADFKDWQKEHPTQRLTYDDWKTSKHVEGLSLYYAALQIWDESESSDEVEEPKTEIRSRSVRGQSAREPKKTLKTNGNGLSRSTGSATPSAAAPSEDLNQSSQKKRRKRKQFLSEELVASDESEEIETSTIAVETTTPSASAVTLNGRRKSGGRKPKKKPLSEETISPEDEEDDPMAMNGFATPTIASPLPVRSAPKSSTAGSKSEPPKRTILKLSTRKTPKKPDDIVTSAATDAGNAAGPLEASITTTVEPNLAASSSDRAGNEENSSPRPGEATASPDPTGDSASATRRGLRQRRPAQQRPYSFDAEIFDGSDTEMMEDEPASPAPPAIASRRVSVASLSNEPYGQLLDPETLAILQGGMGPEPEQKAETQGRPKHFKGKGRAWKKEESDEDLEFNPGKKKAAARAKAKAKAKAQQLQQQLPRRKGGRSKKSILSEDIVHDDSEEDSILGTEEASPSRAASESAAPKGRKATRKSALSEELVHDDSDDDEDLSYNDRPAMPAPPPKASTSTPKKRGRPRLSDQSASSKTQEEPKEAIVTVPVQVTEEVNTAKEEAKPAEASAKAASPLKDVAAEGNTKNETQANAPLTAATNVVDPDHETTNE